MSHPCSVYVGRLSSPITKEMLEDFFGEYGKILDIYMPEIKPNQKYKYAMVKYTSRMEAHQAIQKYDDYAMYGYRLCVKLSDRELQRDSMRQQPEKNNGSPVSNNSSPPADKLIPKKKSRWPPADNTSTPADELKPKKKSRWPPADNTSMPADELKPKKKSRWPPADNTSMSADELKPKKKSRWPPADNTSTPADEMKPKNRPSGGNLKLKKKTINLTPPHTPVSDQEHSADNNQQCPTERMTGVGRRVGGNLKLKKRVADHA